MSDAETHPRVLELPRDETGLATSKPAVRRLQQLLPVFLEDVVADANADGFVVALDGTVESGVTATMAAEAVDPDRVTGLVMPARLSDEASARDAEAVAELIGIDHHRLQLRPLMTAFQNVIGTTGQPADDLVAMHNARERFRMACAYYVSNTTNRLVVGSVDRTDRLLGSVAKFGDSGVDASLLGDLYRTEVRALAEDLDLPGDLADESDRPDLTPGPSDADQLGIAPRTLDSLLRLLVDEGRDELTVADRLDVDPDVVRRVRNWISDTRHKRHQPPKPSMAV